MINDPTQNGVPVNGHPVHHVPPPFFLESKPSIYCAFNQNEKVSHVAIPVLISAP